ncbi:hypothetical protein [Paraburkholderia caffeinilytica]|uniref:hypothetical protein n=1 Tax=Paraburkholderia caffeinilytica TaxID=1761016 RepID=UPI0038BBCC15
MAPYWRVIGVFIAWWITALHAFRQPFQLNVEALTQALAARPADTDGVESFTCLVGAHSGLAKLAFKAQHGAIAATRRAG